MKSSLDTDDSKFDGKLMFLLMFQQLMIMKVVILSFFIRIYIKIWPNPFGYVYRFWIFVTFICAQSHCYWISHPRNHTVTAKLIEKRINRKKVVQVIRVFVRIPLLPWIQWVMIQVTERYETNSFFSVEISWITFFADPSVLTNRP